jgi:hypothetical protein
MRSKWITKRQIAVAALLALSSTLVFSASATKADTKSSNLR